MIFSRLKYFDKWLFFGKYGLNFDWKHLIKRIRGILFSTSRSITLIKHSFSRAQLEIFLPKLSNLLNPSDNQNVKVAVDMLNGLINITSSDISVNQISKT